MYIQVNTQGVHQYVKSQMHHSLLPELQNNCGATRAFEQQPTKLQHHKFYCLFLTTKAIHNEEKTSAYLRKKSQQRLQKWHTKPTSIHNKKLN